MAQHFAVNPQTGERMTLVDGAWVAAAPAGSGSVGPSKVTEGQAKDGFNAKRMVGAETTMTGLEQQGLNPTMSGVGSVLASTPLSAFGVGRKSRGYEAARDEWSDSIIRLTTGAAATKQEINAANRTYFPQFGDPPEVVKQKDAARKRVEQDALTRAGPGAAGTLMPGEKAPGWSPLKSSQDKAQKGGQARIGGAPKGVITYDAQGNRIK